jgi:choline dehydrogenase-like flavoprotein
VALLEAGGPDSSVLIHCPAGLALLAKNGQGNWALETVPQPGLNGRRGYQPRGKVLGGSSSVNAMIYARGHQRLRPLGRAGQPGLELERCAAVLQARRAQRARCRCFHGTGGPLNVKDLTTPNRFGPVFVQAGVQAGFAANPDFNGAEQEGVGMYQVTHKNGERCSAAKAYLTPHLGGPTCRSSPARTPPGS